MSTSRRDFLKFSSLSLVGAAAFGTLTFRPATAQAQAGKLPLVGPNDPNFTTLGYTADASKVDKKKWPKYAAGQSCSNCILFNGGKVTTEAEGACPLFAGKHVAAKGWCNSWAKNPAAK
ncbi:MAG: high-potential iron-sulfur protein [Bdellovibrionales bacterium]|nr:high-potential iron-sulfur protein [Bdellovibrionales bacterium]